MDDPARLPSRRVSSRRALTEGTRARCASNGTPPRTARRVRRWRVARVTGAERRARRRSPEVVARVGPMTAANAGGWSARVSLRRKGLESARILTAPSCAEVVDGVIVMIALVLGPTEEPAPSEPTPPGPPDVAAAPPRGARVTAPAAASSAMATTPEVHRPSNRPRRLFPAPFFGLTAVGLVEAGALLFSLTTAGWESACGYATCGDRVTGARLPTLLTANYPSVSGDPLRACGPDWDLFAATSSLDAGIANPPCTLTAYNRRARAEGRRATVHQESRRGASKWPTATARRDEAREDDGQRGVARVPRQTLASTPVMSKITPSPPSPTTMSIDSAAATVTFERNEKGSPPSRR